MSRLDTIAAVTLVALIVPAIGSARAKDGELRWRVSDQEGQALLAKSDTDKATDNLGLPMLTCKDKTGNVIVEGEAKDPLRLAMARLIQVDGIPWIQVAPDTTPKTTTVDLFYSFIDGWRYRFNIQEDHKSFERFKRDGVLEFKLGKTDVHEEFKPGLESVTKFLDLCKRPSRN